jgi:hypothetical protein
MEEQTTGLTFSDHGINDIETGVHLYNALGIGQGELGSPKYTAQLREIAQFLEVQPDPQFIINSVLKSKRNPEIKNIDHLWNYVRLSKEKGELEDKISLLSKELKFYE